jgi:putative membrane protein insertion efficiency factor
MLATGMIKIYQVAISSQDIPACNFTPSCSRFTSEAIKKAGLIRGALLGADRLLRCHPFARHRRERNKRIINPGSTERIFDPVEQYLHFDIDD